MARIVIPEDFEGQLKLFKLMKARHDALGASSPLTPFLIQQAINLTTDNTNGDAAHVHEASRALFARQSENYSEQRDLRIIPLFKRLRSQIQFIKKYYTGNERVLGDWAVTVDAKNRIVLPGNFSGKKTLFTEWVAKHNSFDPDPSPLTPYLSEHQIDLVNDAALLDTADYFDVQFTQAQKDAEEQTEQRNIKWSPVLKHIHSIAQFLKGLYNESVKKLGEWGFVVDNSPKKPKLQNRKIKPTLSITIKSVVIGSTVTNVGATPVHIYNGSSTSGSPVILPSGEQFGITKGFSAITVVNPSTTLEASITALIRK